ncbi:MAG TPA: tRNA (adenosine(37)-N6)-dimethylallyltransferase MiaA [Candidatus Limnocylindria bacterium]|nr:tRNA (adenosine(37)-N6)-dimethylallyltransferase MiaA [Candidatus Limnocylindria bacterium]
MGASSAPPILGIVGPTASGKTDLALALARRLPVEILVADSRQVYRGMDIGTAKPDAAARQAVPHHLLDLADPDEPFTVADWVERARPLVDAVATRGRLPMLVGGTGLYVGALVDGHDYTTQGWDPELRATLTRRWEVEGLEPLAAELGQREPELAARTDLRNPRRVVRALERSLAGGEGASPRSAPHPGRVVLIGLQRSRDELYRRIDERARRLFAGGLLEEVAALLERGYGPELRPMTGHGYQEAARHLAGEWTLEEAIEVTARRTRQYAKRQLTWFRRDGRIMWLDATGREADDDALVERAERVIRAALT